MASFSFNNKDTVRYFVNLRSLNVQKPSHAYRARHPKLSHERSNPDWYRLLEWRLPEMIMNAIPQLRGEKGIARYNSGHPEWHFHTTPPRICPACRVGWPYDWSDRDVPLMTQRIDEAVERIRTGQFKMFPELGVGKRKSLKNFIENGLGRQYTPRYKDPTAVLETKAEVACSST